MIVVVLRLSLLLLGVRAVTRLKRQTLPSTHVQVFSTNSNFTYLDNIVTYRSPDSRIELNERNLNLTTWATASNVSFDSFETFVNYTAHDAETLTSLRSVSLHSQAADSDFSLNTNRLSDGHSRLRNSLTGHVNVSMADSDMRIEALDGNWADIYANTRDNSTAKKTMNIYSNISDPETFDRRLVLSAVDSDYDMEAILLGARVRTTYGDVMLDIDPDYRRALLYTQTHTVELRTMLSPFGIEFDDERMLINAPFEETTATIPRGTSDVHFQVGQLNQLQVSRGGGDILLGNSSSAAEQLNVTSTGLNMSLLSTREMTATSSQSLITMITNTTTASFTASRHNIDVNGGIPQMVLLTGNLTINITTNPERPVNPTLFPGFSEPPDQFGNVGPPQFPGPGEQTTGGPEGGTTGPGVEPGSGGEGTPAVATEEPTDIETPIGSVDDTPATARPTEEEDRTVGYRTNVPNEGNPGEGGDVTTVGVGEEITEAVTTPEVEATTLLPTTVAADEATTQAGEEAVITTVRGIATTEGTTEAMEVTEGVGGSSSLFPTLVTEPVGVETSTEPGVELSTDDAGGVGGDLYDTTAVVPTTLPFPTPEPSDIPTPSTEPFPSPVPDLGTTPEGFPAPGSTIIDLGASFPTPPSDGSLTTESLITPPDLPTDDFVFPPTLVTEDDLTTTDEFIIGQYESTGYNEGQNAFTIFATLSGVNFGPTPLVATQRLEGVTEPLPLVAKAKRSPLSRTESFRMRLRVPRTVKFDGEMFRRNISESLYSIANCTVESSAEVTERRRRDIEVDPIQLNVSNAELSSEDEASMEFSMGLHDFENIETLIDAIKSRLPNVSDAGVVIIEHINISNSSTPSYLIVLIVIAVLALVLLTGLLIYKKIIPVLVYKGMRSCTSRSRVSDSSVSAFSPPPFFH